MTIRPAIADDLDHFSAIEKSAGELFRGTAMEFAMGDPPLDRETLEHALGEGTLWLAEREGARAGFLCSHRLGDLLYIDELAVASEFQGHGLGRALMAHCIDNARERFAGIALTTDRELPWNAPFYATLGFALWPKPSAEIAAKLDEEIAAGFDPDRRCAMLLELG